MHCVITNFYLEHTAMVSFLLFVFVALGIYIYIYILRIVKLIAIFTRALGFLCLLSELQGFGVLH